MEKFGKNQQSWNQLSMTRNGEQTVGLPIALHSPALPKGDRGIGQAGGIPSPAFVTEKTNEGLNAQPIIPAPHPQRSRRVSC